MSSVAQPRTVRLLSTAAHACGYWPERTARNVLLDAASTPPGAVYPGLLAAGFRRSGDTIYRPRCDACNACVPVRIPVAEFRADRSQRRCLARNADLSVQLTPASPDAEVLDLYQRYLESRHPRSGMFTSDAGEFADMFLTAWSGTRFLVVRGGSRLVAVAVTDITRTGCSAVYTFFEPARTHAARGLGTFAILSQIALTRTLGLPHLYLGYWLDRHADMHYKERFRPQERLESTGWVDRTG